MKSNIDKRPFDMRIENWCGCDIRFVEVGGEWWAILKDICDALNLHTFKIAQRLDPDMLTRVRVDICDIPSKEVRSRARKTQDMLAVNEIGIYEALYASRKLEARKFRRWSATVMQKLRNKVGLKSYEALRMTEPEIQKDIDTILDTIFWDEDKKCVMQSVTVAGGDVEQVPFE